ncbi:MAG TPA: hypothetical protein VHB25_19415 [Gemmatimonadaceae bacterium]|nr:hypothetical protein [Gemmatimonadaceae bacterium]
MTDYRQDRSDTFKQPIDERGNPHGGRGRRAQRDIAEQFETQTGRPLGDQRPIAEEEAPRGDVRRSRSDPTGVQHARKGQAESPRELTLNQPEKKRGRRR